MPKFSDLPTANSVGDSDTFAVFQGGALKQAAYSVFASTGSAFYVDPHAAPFNATGDGKATYNLGIFTDGSGNATLVGIKDAVHTFSASDVGKSMWLQDGNVYSITAYNSGTGRVTISPAAPGWTVAVSSGGYFYGCWGTDDTAAIQAALDYANTMSGEIGEDYVGSITNYVTTVPGGTVKLHAGKSYIIRNKYASGKVSCLQMPRRTALEGCGMNASFLLVTPDSDGHGITLKNAKDNGKSYADYVRLSDFTLLGGGAAVSSTNLDGINLNWAAGGGGYPNTDCFARIEAVKVRRMSRHGFVFTGTGESIFSNLQAQANGRVGIWFNAVQDSVVYRCNSGGNDKTGIRITSGGPLHFFGCKSYYNGAAADTVDVSASADATGRTYPAETLAGNSANWWLETTGWDFGGGCILTSCESQESVGSGFLIESGQNQFTNCHAADAGRTTYGPSQANRPSVIAGFQLSGTECHNNFFANCYVGAELARLDSPCLGYSTHIVHIAGVDGSGRGPHNNMGDFYHMLPFVKYDGSTYTPTIGFGSPAAISATTARGGPTGTGKNTGIRVNGAAYT